MPHGRWLGDFEPLSDAELQLVEYCARGEAWAPDGWDWEDRRPPDEPRAENRLRAELLRFLLLGGDQNHPVHEAGLMCRGAWIDGVLDLHQCHVPRKLDLRWCHFAETPDWTAATAPEIVLSGSILPELYADRLTVAGGLFLDEGFETDGEVRLLGAGIGNNLVCSGGKFRNSDGGALSADRIRVTGSAFLQADFEADGEVRLLGAEIGGSLHCSSGKFRNPGGRALTADRIKVTGSVFLRADFESEGEVRFLSAEVGSNLECSGGKFRNPDGDALSADSLVVSGSVFFQKGFESDGEVRLLGAEIGGNLECSGGKFRNPDGDALTADGIKITDSGIFQTGFEADGEVRLHGAEIGGNLACSGGEFRNPDGDALSADRMVLTGAAILGEAKFAGALALPAARIGALVDDMPCWSSGGHTFDGLQYAQIVGAVDATSRITWLRTQRADQLDARNFAPQPWEHLAKVLRDSGHTVEANEIAYAKQEQMRRADRVGGPLRRRLHWLYGALAGYGYKPMRLVWTLIGLFLGGVLLFELGAQYGYMGPTDPVLTNPDLAPTITATCGHAFEVGKQPWTDCSAMPPEYSVFSSLVYSLDVILPLVDLQQEVDWSPIVEDANGRWLEYGMFLRFYVWLQIVFGWVASLMLVAILGRLVEKD